MECIRAGSNLQKKAAKSFIIQHMAASYRSKPPKQKHCPSPRVDKMAWGVCDLPFLHFSLVVLFDQSDDGCLLTSSFCFLAYLARADICEQTRENRSSVLFSHLVVSNSLQPCEPQHARPPCPSTTPRVYPNSCPLNWWYHPTISSSVIPFSSIFPRIRVFSNESALHIRWPKYWSFSFNICPSNEHPGLISFRMDWLDLLAVQGTLKSLLQHHSSKASILWHSAFFIVQLSHPYMATGKSIALTTWTFVGKTVVKKP